MQATLTAEPWGHADRSHEPAVNAAIELADRLARLEAPSAAPELDLQAAQWGLSCLAWSVFLLVDRSQADTALPKELAEAEPSGDLAGHHWSIDLSFRYLHDVLVRARAAAAEDGLVGQLEQLCSRWPLASVGTGLALPETRARTILENDCLRRVLLDRIIAKSDRELLAHSSLAPYAAGYNLGI